MPNLDDTQPNKPINAGPTPRKVDLLPPEDDAPGGPGCLIWGVMLSFMAVLGLLVVVLAAFAGWAEGQQIGVSNATARAQAEISRQCDLIPADLAAGNLELAGVRFDALATLSPAPDCLALYAPTATARFIESQPTVTPTATTTATLSPASPTATIVTEAAPETTQAADADSAFDPAYWLAEAQRLLQAGETEDAIAALEAVTAIDPTFEKATVDRLLFNALSSEAERLFRSGQNLALAIALADRASQYGDIGALNYESYIAGLYLEAQSMRDVNYPRAIQALREIVVDQGLTNYLDARRQLIEQYENYGDALVAGFDHCPAVVQYNNALTLANNPALIAKRDRAETNCQSLTPGAPVDPNATPDPNAPTQPAVAPIGVPGT